MFCLYLYSFRYLKAFKRFYKSLYKSLYLITGLSEFLIHKMKVISTPGLSRRDALAISMLVMTQITYTTWLLKAHLMMEWSLQLKCMVGLKSVIPKICYWANCLKSIYRTRAIISRGVYIYPISNDHFFVFKEVFSENTVLLIKSGL